MLDVISWASSLEEYFLFPLNLSNIVSWQSRRGIFETKTERGKKGVKCSECLFVCFLLWKTWIQWWPLISFIGLPLHQVSFDPLHFPLILHTRDAVPSRTYPGV